MIFNIHIVKQLWVWHTVTELTVIFNVYKNLLKKFCFSLEEYVEKLACTKPAETTLSPTPNITLKEQQRNHQSIIKLKGCLLQQSPSVANHLLSDYTAKQRQPLVRTMRKWLNSSYTQGNPIRKPVVSPHLKHSAMVASDYSCSN